MWRRRRRKKERKKKVKNWKQWIIWTRFRVSHRRPGRRDIRFRSANFGVQSWREITSAKKKIFLSNTTSLEVQKPSVIVCYTPSSEPFRFYEIATLPGWAVSLGSVDYNHKRNPEFVNTRHHSSRQTWAQFQHICTRLSPSSGPISCQSYASSNYFYGSRHFICIQKSPSRNRLLQSAPLYSESLKFIPRMTHLEQGLTMPLISVSLPLEAKIY
jgi:hypothetical protein